MMALHGGFNFQNLSFSLFFPLTLAITFSYQFLEATRIRPLSHFFCIANPDCILKYLSDESCNGTIHEGLEYDMHLRLGTFPLTTLPIVSLSDSILMSRFAVLVNILLRLSCILLHLAGYEKPYSGGLILDVDGHAYYRFIGLGCQAHQASIISLWVAIGPSPLRTPVVCLSPPTAIINYFL
jgi:hypothetical protein